MIERQVTLVTPNWRWDVSPLATDTLRPPVSYPLEWAYFAAEYDGPSPTVVDAYLKDMAIDEAVDAVVTQDPQYIVVMSTPNLLYWRCPPLSMQAPALLIRHLRAHSSATIILVGPHGTNNPRWALRRSGADAVFRGAAEIGLARYFSGSVAHETYLETSHRHARAVFTIAGSELPRAVWEAPGLQALAYPAHMWHSNPSEPATKGPGVLVEASRGCPWSCIYCAKEPVRGDYSRRPLDLIECELNDLAAIGVQSLFFIDETFNVPSDHLRSLLQILRDSGFTWGFQGRPDIMTDEFAALMGEAGCVYAEFGLDVVGQVGGPHGRNLLGDRGLEGISSARASIPIVRYNRLNFQTHDYKNQLGLGAARSWSYPPDPVYPYPGTGLGTRLMALYEREPDDWEFAEHYSWWLRMEVEFMRAGTSEETIEREQRRFLRLPRPKALAEAEAFASRPAVDFHTRNRFIRGEGQDVAAELRDTYTGPLGE